ncbi:hypothetical protein TNCT_551641 [Trichonephila clavata]|uniref:Uncharacterized protein n=1 Tax=Trichonephila clavata TaxID=2740835 RepID=A0A8X6HVF9_TRICU|nr:hypothetical protein TNCT_551641 [Trichonephila clavata]
MKAAIMQAHVLNTLQVFVHNSATMKPTSVQCLFSHIALLTYIQLSENTKATPVLLGLRVLYAWLPSGMACSIATNALCFKMAGNIVAPSLVHFKRCRFLQSPYGMGLLLLKMVV